MKTIIAASIVFALTAVLGNSQTEAGKSSKDTLQFTSSGHVLGFASDGIYVASGSHALRVEFVNARATTPVSGTPASDDVPDNTRRATPLSQVTYPNLWEGVTLTYDAAGGIVRSTYRIDPNANTNNIRLRYNAPVSLQDDRSLRIGFQTGTLNESAPVAWQERDGKRVPVGVAFAPRGKNEVGFVVGAYDRSEPLFIDPTLTWNTFLGGSGFDSASAVAVDGSGNVYVAGESETTWGSPVRAFSGRDIFVAKLNSSGNLTWNTFLGGGDLDWRASVAVDGSGNVYVAGESLTTWGSPVLPFSAGASANGFAAKLNSSGNLTWNTFLGGNGSVGALAVAADGSGNVYVAGESSLTWGSPVRAHSGGYDGFAAKLNSSGNLTWNTFLGSSIGNEIALGVAVDGTGNVYVAGMSPATWGSPVRAYSSNTDGFAAKLNSSGNLTWNTFLGGNGSDTASALAVDGSGNVYLAGYTDATWGSPVRAHSGSYDAFAAKLNSSGNLSWNTFLGGTTDDFGEGLAVDGSGNVYVSGSSDATWGSPFRTYSGGGDAFAAKLDSSGNLTWNAFVGGSDFDGYAAVAVDGSGTAYVAGYAGETWGSPVRSHSGSADAFVVQVSALNNDNFANAQAISGSSGTIYSTTIGSTREAGEPLHAGNAGGHSIWYVWTAPTSGTYTFNTAGSSFDTLLAVYTGNAVGSLTFVASDDDAIAPQSLVSFSATAGVIYHIAVDGSGGQSGSVALNWVLPPANDNFANAQPISGTSGTVIGTTIDSTKETGEPFHGGNAGGRSVWYTWTAPSSGTYAFDTAGSSFDTLLAVYSGNNLATLTEIASDDDALAPQSKVSFLATAGVIYHIVVDGYNGDSGSVTLNWDMPPIPPNDNFSNSQLISGSSGAVSGTTIASSREAGEPFHAGNAGGHSIWYAWTAPSSATYIFDTEGSSFNTLLAVYTGNAVGSLTLVASNDDAIGLQSRVHFSATAGVVYHIAVDGFGGQSGSVTLNWLVAGAGSATWLQSPPTNEWDNAANWTPGGPPGSYPYGGDTATFATSNQTTVLCLDATVDGITFSAGASPFTIEVSSNLGLNGAGIANNSGIAQSFVIAGEMSFHGSSTAGSATHVTTSGAPSGVGGVLYFDNNSTAGNGTFVTESGFGTLGRGQTLFFGNSTAASGNFTNNGGTLSGYRGGFTWFDENSTAGSATFSNHGAAVSGAFSGSMLFFLSSTASNAVIINNGGVVSGVGGGFTQFFEDATAENCTITNGGGTIAGAFGGATFLSDNSSAGNATLIANGGLVSGAFGGRIYFYLDNTGMNGGSATGGTSRIKLFGNGALDISFHNSPGVTIGSLEGDGNAFLGSNNLTVGSNNLSTTFSGVIQDGGENGGSGGSLTKIGTGALSLSGNNTYTGATIVNGGILSLNGSLANGAVGITANGQLINNGTIGGNVSVSGQLSGCGIINGSLTVNLGGIVDLDGCTLTVNGPITNDGLFILSNGAQLAGSSPSFTNNGTLDLITVGTFTPPPGFVNNGIIIDSSVVKSKTVQKIGNSFTVTIDSYTGHTYQLQKATTLAGNSFSDIGAPQQGSTGTVLTFTDANATGPTGFYRIIVNP